MSPSTASADPIAAAVASLAACERTPAQPRLRSHPMLAALRRAGTVHVYADSADPGEIGALVGTGDELLAEVDGSTANQPLIRKVIERYIAAADLRAWAAELRRADAGLSDANLLAVVYGMLCARAGADVVAAYAAGRAWGVSLQLHMNLVGDAAAAVRTGRLLRRLVPQGVIKIPFSPHAPECFLVARDLEREGIPVNFTSTFSARQTVAAALLSNVALTNIFMGRINQGLQATLAGEHVDLAAQRALRQLRRDHGSKTLLIVASVREWQTFVHTAGCDVYTSPCSAIAGLLNQTEVAPEDLRDRVGDSFLDSMTIGTAAESALGRARIARLWDVEPEFVEFLVELRDSDDYASMHDGEQLFDRFQQAGFADFFHSPSPDEWSEIRRDKLPDLGGTLVHRLPLDTLYTLLADADFDKYQEEMDAMLRPLLGR